MNLTLMEKESSYHQKLMKLETNLIICLKLEDYYILVAKQRNKK